MLIAILLLLIVFWFLGYGPIATLSIPLFLFNGRTVTLWDTLIFLLVIGLIGSLPSPFREIAAILLLLWLLSVFGIFVFANLSSLILIAIIVGLVLYIAGGYSPRG